MRALRPCSAQALMCLIAALLSACTSLTPAERLDAQAARAGLSRAIVRGTEFQHVVYSRTAPDSHLLTIYIEGDGLPMVGDRVVKDPTTREPMALPLMLQSRSTALLVSRPCYHELNDPRCTWRDWTLGRYSQAVVESMTAVVRAKARELGVNELRLVGYSGGGALAVLIAERMDNVTSVVTIAANLDIDAWTTHHRYTPLADSLNPARSDRAHSWREIHLQGGGDDNVPSDTTRAYFERFPNAKRVTFENYDHVCCWVRDWEKIAASLRDPSADGVRNPTSERDSRL